jgi:hypothetical protein
MRHIISFLLITMLFACNSQKNDTQSLQSKTDSLQTELNNAYKPGLGEFMSGIQVHHAKLWFAGQNQNWKLADFEINEIKEAIDDIKKYCTDRPEAASIIMIQPAIDSISNAILQKNIIQFKSDYILLTTTCNSCHHATTHAFNVIKIPDTPPFSNQDFKSDGQ